jgi:hypothetical protein
VVSSAVIRFVFTFHVTGWCIPLFLRFPAGDDDSDDEDDTVEKSDAGDNVLDRNARSGSSSPESTATVASSIQSQVSRAKSSVSRTASVTKSAAGGAKSTKKSRAKKGESKKRAPPVTKARSGRKKPVFVKLPSNKVTRSTEPKISASGLDLDIVSSDEESDTGAEMVDEKGLLTQCCESKISTAVPFLNESCFLTRSMFCAFP